MAADVASIMTGLATALDGIAGLRVFAYPPDSLAPPAAVVAFPDEVEYDTTMARGCDRVVVPVHIVVGRVSVRSSAPALAAYLSGTGASSVKTVVESDKTLAGAAQTTRVTGATVTATTMGGVDYLTATFSCEVIA